MMTTCTLTATECPKCGVPFAIPSLMYGCLKVSGNDFWCPNGHKLFFDPKEKKHEETITRNKSTTDAVDNVLDHLDGKVQCFVCKRWYKNKASLKSHQRLHCKGNKENA